MPTPAEIEEIAKVPKIGASKTEQVSRAEQDAKLREKAARQAAKVAKDPEPIVMVQCRVMKAGDGKISTGLHVAGIGEVHYERDETFPAEQATATGYEDRGWVEILK